MRLRPLASVVLLLPLLGCPLTGPEETGTTLTGTFSTQFVETSTHQGTVTQTCSDTYTLAGTLTFVVRNATGTLEGDGRINATQTHISTSGTGCTPTPNRSTGGDWTAQLTGTPGDASFAVERTGTGSFPGKTTFTFTGTIGTTAADGTLTFTQTAQGTTGTNTQSSSSAQASISVALR